MEGIPTRKESTEKEPQTRILVLSASMYGEDREGAIVQIDKDFDVKAAKAEFDASLTENQESQRALNWGDPMLKDFADWLVAKGLAKHVAIVPYHEGN